MFLKIVTLTEGVSAGLFLAVVRTLASNEARGVARRRPGSTGFNILPSQLNLNGYPFKKRQLSSRLGSTL